MASTYELIVKAVDQTSGPLRKIEKSVEGLNKQAQGVSKTLKIAGTAFAGFLTGNVVRNIVQTTAKFEDFRDTLDTVTGSAKSGGEAFKFIQKFATQTQFGVEDLTQTFIKLKGAGIEPTQELLTSFTDVAAVTTDQIGTLNAVTDLFSRTTSGGLGLEELNRLADRGVPVFKMLEDQLGITRNEVSEYGKTAEGAKSITEALLRGINQNFGGATQKKMDNLSTAMSNFGIAVTNAAARLGDRFRPQLTGAITDATKFIETNNELIDALGDGLGEAIKSSVGAIRLIAENIELVSTAAQAVLGVKLIQYFGNVTKQLGGFLVTLTATTAALGKKNVQLSVAQTRMLAFGTAVNKTGKSLATFGAILATPFKSVFGALGTLATRLGLVTAAGIALAKVGPLLLNPWTAAIAAIGATVYGLFKYFEDTAIQIADVNTNVGEVVGALWWKTTEYIKGVWTSVVNYFGEKTTQIGNYLGEVWTLIKDNFKTAMSPISSIWAVILSTVTDYAKTLANKVIGAFVFIYGAVKDTVFSIPDLFLASFNAVKATVLEFAAGIAGTFGNIGSAIKQALTGDFEGAIATATQNAFSNMGGVIDAELKKVADAAPDYGKIAGEAFGTDYVAAAGDKLNGLYLNVTGFAQDAATKTIEAWDSVKAGVSATIDGVKTSIASTVKEYRQHNYEVNEAAGLYDLYDDAALRASRGLGQFNEEIKKTTESQDPLTKVTKTYADFLKELRATIDENVQTAQWQNQAYKELTAEYTAGKLTLTQYREAMSLLNKEFQDPSVNLYQQYLKGIIDSASASAREIGFAAIAKQDLKKQLDQGKISLDVYAQAMKSLNKEFQDPSIDLYQQYLKGIIDTATASAREIGFAAMAKQDLKKQLDEGKISLDVYTEAMKKLNKEFQDPSIDLYQQYLKNVIDTASASAREIGFAAMAKQDLKKQLDEGKISLDVYAEAMKKLTGTTTKEKSETEKIIDSIKEKNKQIDNLTNNLKKVSELSKQSGIDETVLQEALQKRLDTLNEVGEKSKSIAETINESFKKAADGLSRSLAQGLAKGKLSLNSFKDFFNQILEDILQAIIQKNLTDPLVAGLTGGSAGGGLGGILGSLFGTPTVGAPMGGLDFGGFFSGITSFLGFANGGVPPVGRASLVGERGPELFVPNTAGRIVPNDEINMGGGETVVNFNINAISTQTGIEFLLKNKPQIIGMVTQAQNQRGRQGITA